LGALLEYPLVEFLVDLTRGEGALLQAMHKKHRKNLRLAQESGLDVVEDATLEAFLSVREMQQSSAERSAEKGNRYGIQDERFYRESFEAIYRNGPGRVLFARKDGIAAAALAYLEFGRKAITVRSGSTPVGYETSAMYLLQFELIKRLAQRGFSELNIGGVPADAAELSHPQHGLFDYKRYYGGIPRACAGFTFNVKAGGSNI
jgi:lipid II:glycine glycyltransferase (peptidoglycan interpeptide bridge formation enzyme)